MLLVDKMYICRKCRGFFPLEEMAKEGKGKAVYYCKECRRKAKKARYEANPEYYREYQRVYGKAYRVTNKEQINLSSRERYDLRKLLNSKSDTAKAAVMIDLRSSNGNLTRQPCEVCGKKAHAHHEDYNKPLEVRWLCPLHHMQRHKEMRSAVN